jgi:hypothetical protein
MQKKNIAKENCIVDGEHLQEDDVRIMALYDLADGLYPPVYCDVLTGPDVVRHELDLSHVRVEDGSLRALSL